MADYSQYSPPSSEWMQYVQAPQQPPPPGLSMEGRRDYLNKSRAELHKKIYGPKIGGNIEISELSIPTSDNSTVEARLYRPRGSATHTESGLPCIIHLHSGGWHLGDLETEDAFCAYLCSALYRRSPPGAVVLNVNYRHTPEFRYPTQLDDAYAALEFVTRGPETGPGQLGVEVDKVILEGTSAGAHLAIGCAVRDTLQDEGSKGGTERRSITAQRRINGLILTCPPTVSPDLFPYHLLRSRDVSSYVQNANDPVLSIERATTFWNMYLGAGSNNEVDGKLDEIKTHPTISPLITERQDIFNADAWPHTSFHVAGMDPLRDEGLLFEDKLRRGGIQTRLEVYEGFPHAFNLLPQLRESERWIEGVLEDLDGFI